MIEKKKKMKNVNIVAVERDGRHQRIITIALQVLDKMTEEDVKDAICKACTEYCQTEEGKKLYIGNCHNFNYGDFEAYVPNSICEKHGIHKIDSNMTDIEVNFDTDLVDEIAVLGEDEDE